MTDLSRRQALWLLGSTASAASGFFTIGRRNNRVCLVDPSGRPFFSLGLNHIDSAALRSDDTWEREFGNDSSRWLRFVRDDLLRWGFNRWGFNTAGWVQEVAVINEHHHRHSRSFSLEE